MSIASRATDTESPERTLTALLAVFREIGQATDATCSLRPALELVSALCSAETVAVFLAWPDGSVRPLIWHSSDQEWTISASDARTGFVAEAVATGSPASLLVTSTAVPVYLTVVPMHCRGRVTGALVLENRSDPGLDTTARAAVELMAAQLGLALETTLMYEVMEEHYQGFLAVMESINEGFVLATGDEVVYANHKAAELLGADRASLEQGGVAGLAATLARRSTNPRDILRRFDSMTGTERRWSITVEREGPDRRLYRLYSFPVQSHQAEILGYAYLLRDVTEELEIDRMKSELVSFISHELASPITAVKGLLTTLERSDVEWSPQQRARFIRTIIAGTDRLQRLVEDTMEATRLEARAFQAEKTAVRLGDLIGRCLREAKSRFPRADIRAAEVEEKIIFRVNAQGIERVILNLIENAVKYSSGRAWVRLSARVDGPSILLEVRDRGLGVDVADRERIFEKFYRSKDPKVRSSRGTGLGLSLARAIVSAHHGRIWVEDAPDRGSVFLCRFPYPTREEVAER